ncbi:MAG: hypothetical protein K2Y37_23615 [Pirellulales bacterium]|nr:hypothetical protein [Pirellulales bacterium]
MRGQQLIYRSLDALGPVQRLIEEATDALSEQSQAIIRNTPLAEIAGAAAGVGAGAATGAVVLSAAAAGGTTGAAALTSGLATAGAVVGGGMTAGIAVVAAPAVLFGVGAYAVTAHLLKKRKMKALKEALLKECITKQDAIQNELNRQTMANAERVKRLEGILAELRGAIRNLKIDTAVEAA